MKSYKLGRYLIVAPPEDMDITFQTFKEFSETEFVLCGWHHYELRYFIAAKAQAGGKSHEECWSEQERWLKNESDDGKLRIVKIGGYETDVQRKISYRIYQQKFQGQDRVVILHLIISRHCSYWVQAHIVSPADPFAIHEALCRVLKTARLTAPKKATSPTASSVS